MKAFSTSTVAFLLFASIGISNNAFADGSGSVKNNGTEVGSSLIPWRSAGSSQDRRSGMSAESS